MEALAHPLLIAAAGVGQRCRELEQRGAQFLAHAQVGQGCGDAEHKEGTHLALGQAGEGGAVAVDQGKAALGTGLAVDRHTGEAEGVDVAVNRPLRDVELLGQLAGCHLSARLQEHEQR